MHGQFGHCKNKLKLTSSNLKGSYYSIYTHVFTFSMGGKACSTWQQLPSVCLTSFLQFTAQYGQAPFALAIYSPCFSLGGDGFFGKNCWFCREEPKFVGERSACKVCINLWFHYSYQKCKRCFMFLTHVARYQSTSTSKPGSLGWILGWWNCEIAT